MHELAYIIEILTAFNTQQNNDKDVILLFRIHPFPYDKVKFMDDSQKRCYTFSASLNIRNVLKWAFFLFGLDLIPRQHFDRLITCSLMILGVHNKLIFLSTKLWR